ncbi:MAG TPA: cysteine--tRNA ligase [Phycisphaerales bacterium]|nr:cysteine--tRNA ligase [Phycisphaerales bacterium]
MPMMLYNTLTHSLQPLRPADPERITFYSCGPTVYDDAHIGNFRSFLAADVLRRWLESPLCEVVSPDGSTHRGPRIVRHVMNITDVGHMTEDNLADGGGEDKMQAAAKRIAAQQRESKKAGTAHALASVDPNDPRAIADFYTERFLDDARRLGLKVAIEATASIDKRRELMPRATESIAGMREMIETLAEKGFAYRAGDAVYFDVHKFPRYGQLSGNTLDKLREGAGGRIDEAHTAEKRSPADFLLWKADRSHIVRWPGPTINGEPVGEGYPGWHIECSVMARAALGDEIDLHSGGEDNIFPHHECERAQTCCATGHDTFARHWFHGRFLLVEGQKMSKSKGNFYTPRQLFDQGIEPAALRLELIKTHYRTNANFTMQGLKDSARIITRWRTLLDKGKTNPGEPTDPSVRDEFARAMHDDLNVAEAIGVINAWRNRLERPTTGDVEMLREFDAVLGLLELEQPGPTETAIGVYLDGLEPSPEIETLLADRAEARKAKDYAASDAIRDKLAERGYAIKDIAGGRVEVSRP